MKRIVLLTVLALGILGDATAQAQFGGVPLWTNRYNGPASFYDHANAVAVDGSGNVVVTGYTDGDFYGGGSDFTTIKYSGAGVALWTNRYNGAADSIDFATAIAVDHSGNAFVTGQSFGSGSGYDYATIAYSGAGVALWTNRYDGPGNNGDYVRAVAVDHSGNVFVTGTSYASGSYDDWATIKYSGAGVPLWTNRYDAANDTDAAYALALDDSGNVFVTGGSARRAGAQPDYATIKYSGAGIALWTNYYNGPEDSEDQANAVAVDRSGNVCVTGVSYEPFAYPLSSEYATIAYSGTGVALWTNRYNGPGNNEDVAGSIAVDGGGNVFVTGFSVATNGYSDYLTIKYSGAGLPLWTNRYSGPGNYHDVASALAVDGSGSVFVTGYSVGIDGIYSDYATIAYSGAGMPLWTNRYRAFANSGAQASAVAVDASGNVFVTGYSYAYFDDFTTIKYSSAIPPSLTIARTTTNTVAISWTSPSTGFTLQQNTNNVATANWSNVLTTPTDDGTTKSVIVNPPTASRFFRLKSQ